jgi:hypothetical protein
MEVPFPEVNLVKYRCRIEETRNMACRPRLAREMIIVLAAWVTLGCYKESTSIMVPIAGSVHTRNAVECRLRLGPANPGVSAELHIDDPGLIRDLVLEPIGQAERDPRPAKYVYLGNLIVKNEDGSETYYVLFDPWGHFGTADEYFVTDLSKLHVAFMNALDGSRACLDQADVSGASKKP